MKCDQEITHINVFKKNCIFDNILCDSIIIIMANIFLFLFILYIIQRALLHIIR